MSEPERQARVTAPPSLGARARMVRILPRSYLCSSVFICGYFLFGDLRVNFHVPSALLGV